MPKGSTASEPRGFISRVLSFKKAHSWAGGGGHRLQSPKHQQQDDRQPEHKPLPAAPVHRPLETKPVSAAPAAQPAPIKAKASTGTAAAEPCAPPSAAAGPEGKTGTSGRRSEEEQHARRMACAATQTSFSDEMPAPHGEHKDGGGEEEKQQGPAFWGDEDEAVDDDAVGEEREEVDELFGRRVHLLPITRHGASLRAGNFLDDYWMSEQ